MARVDDVVFNFISLITKRQGMTAPAKHLLEEAVRYGFEQGESFGKYEKYADEVREEIAREIFQENETRKLQKVVRTYGEYKPVELQTALDEGWIVAMANQLGGGYGLEYIIERTEIDGRTKAVKNPEETNGKEAERN